MGGAGVSAFVLVRTGGEGRSRGVRVAAVGWALVSQVPAGAREREWARKRVWVAARVLRAGGE